jgi:hypothetical protein
LLTWPSCHSDIGALAVDLKHNRLVRAPRWPFLPQWTIMGAS